MEGNPKVRPLYAAHAARPVLAASYSPPRHKRKRHSRRRSSSSQATHSNPLLSSHLTLFSAVTLANTQARLRRLLERPQQAWLLPVALLLLLLLVGAGAVRVGMTVGTLGERVESIEQGQRTALEELDLLKGVSHRVDLLFNRVLELRTTTEGLVSEIEGVNQRLPSGESLLRLPAELEQINLQMQELEERIVRLGEGGDLVALQQLMQQMYQRVSTLNHETEALVRHVAEAAEVSWSDPFMLTAGRGGAEDGDWSITLPSLRDRSSAEQIAGGIKNQGLIAIVFEHQGGYRVKIEGFESVEHARNYLLQNLGRKAFDGAWLSRR